jgi:hypothetical protein
VSQHGVVEDSGLIHIEHYDGDFVVHTETERSRVHDLQTLRKRFGERKAVIAARVGILLGITIVNAIDLGGFQNDVGANLARAQSRRGIGVKLRVARTGG